MPQPTHPMQPLVIDQQPAAGSVEDHLLWFESLLLTNPTVALVNRLRVDQVAALKIIVVELARQNSDLVSRVRELTAIAPQRIKLPSGQVMRWNAPDEFVPLQDFTPQSETAGPTPGPAS